MHIRYWVLGGDNNNNLSYTPLITPPIKRKRGQATLKTTLAKKGDRLL